MLLRIFEELIANKPDQAGLQLLFKICQNIARTYLYKRSLSNNYTYFINKDDINDLSLEIIEPLFLTNKNDEKPGIVHSFENLRMEIKSESQCYYVLHKIIWHRAEQHLTTVLKDRDPVFARILKNLYYMLSKYELKKLSYLGKVYAVKKNVDKIDSKVIDENTFNDIPFDMVTVEAGSDFEKLFSIIENDYSFFPAIPLIALAKRIKKSISEDYKNSYSSSALNEGYHSIRINELVEHGLNKSISHLNDFYLARKKLTAPEGELFVKGLKDIAEDAKNGGIKRGLYDYLFNHKNDLSKEEFQLKYYQSFEYLVRIFKNTIADEILDQK